MIMATWSDLSIQNSSSPIMEQLSFFHDHTMTIIIVMTMIVAYSMSSMLLNKYSLKHMLHGHTIEMVWTTLPAMTLIFIALPSFKILYMLDDSTDSNLTIKTIGRQWYWSYEYFENIEFDSYMIPETEMENKNFSCWQSNHSTIQNEIRMLTSASDVIHSWTIPSAGIKIDASPGRINQGMFSMNRPGLFFGQCSEICGANHSFMPITLESTSTNMFIKWLSNMI
uniref:Cytochrome c oxidase subunit 2 n=1 Tax=Proscopia sp. HS-2014 TaxID=1564209 RepID=A0A0N7ARY4_9ORTH|nr:cytochrome c oxidase subunit 2 [Proscopia sp. HS-2014]